MISASVGSDMKMDRAYIDQEKGQAMCCWTAPDKQSIEKLFEQAQVKPESIKQVTVYSG